MQNTNLAENNPVNNQVTKPKTFLFIIIALIAVVVFGGVFLLVKGKSGSNNNSESIAPTPYLPQADPRIKVDLKPQETGKTVLLTISDYPDDVYSIEYELTYKSDKKQEGVFGTIQIKPGDKSVSRELTLGTCSSGKCVYHNIVGSKGTLTVKFNAKSGASRFQKEFSLL